MADAPLTPKNPHWDYLGRYWQMGYDGTSLDACTGDAPIKAWHEGKAARLATSSPPVAAVPATPVWDGKLPEALQRKLNALRLECAPAIVSDVEHEVRSVFEGMHTSLATVKRMYAAARDRLEAAEPQVDPFAQPQPQPAQPLTAAGQGGMTIVKALRMGLRAEVWLDGGTGPKACVGICAIQPQGWTHTADTAKAWADAYNRAIDNMRAAYALTAPSTPTPEVAP